MDQQALDVQFEIMERKDMSAIIGTPLASGKLTGEYTALKRGNASRKFTEWVSLVLSYDFVCRAVLLGVLSFCLGAGLPTAYAGNITEAEQVRRNALFFSFLMKHDGLLAKTVGTLARPNRSNILPLNQPGSRIIRQARDKRTETHKQSVFHSGDDH